MDLRNQQITLSQTFCQSVTSYLGGRAAASSEHGCEENMLCYRHLPWQRGTILCSSSLSLSGVCPEGRATAIAALKAGTAVPAPNRSPL